jgi:hypothetical protein
MESEVHLPHYSLTAGIKEDHDKQTEDSQTSLTYKHTIMCHKYCRVGNTSVTWRSSVAVQTPSG